jgi:cell division protein FtsZ
LLDDNNIKGAKNILINISYGEKEVLLDEITEITDYVQDEAGMDVDDIIWGACYNESLNDELSVIVVATGFPKNDMTNTRGEFREGDHKKRFDLDPDKQKSTIKPVLDEPKLEDSKFEEPSLFNDESNKDNEIVFDFSRREEGVPDDVNVEENQDSQIEPISESENNFSTEFKPSTKEEKGLREMDEINRLQNEQRQNTLKQLSVKLKSPGYLSHIENEPAYKRRNIDLDESSHSSKSEMSRFTLGDSEGGDKPEIRENNSFLHDNVD